MQEMGADVEACGCGLERIKRKEIRELDTSKTIALLCHDTDYTKPPYAPKPGSGLIELQELFKKTAALQNICKSQGWQFCFIGKLECYLKLLSILLVTQICSGKKQDTIREKQCRFSLMQRKISLKQD
jgi:hypothetical protein